MILRPYQAEGFSEITTHWSLFPQHNTLAVWPTGAGKTVLFTNIIKHYNIPTCVIAHRKELVSQASLTLAKFGIKHNIIGPDNVIRDISCLHVMMFNKNYYNARSKVAVAGIDTLLRKGPSVPELWLKTVRLLVMDEAHHVLRKNKWGKGVGMFPNAVTFGVTATPERADGYGLGRHADGYFDHMVVGPTSHELMLQGYLSDAKVFAPPNDFNASKVAIGSSGDFVRNQLTAETRKSRIYGDVVTHYLKNAKGKIGISFTTDIQSANDVKNLFHNAGVPTEVLTGKTPDRVRFKVLDQLKRREILQVVNVDLFGEGFDLPAIECVSDAAATVSFGRFIQRRGRLLRIIEGKKYGIYNDHVGNTIRHGKFSKDYTTGEYFLDFSREWTLDRRDRKKSESTGIPARTCPSCAGIYPGVKNTCPYCGYVVKVTLRSSPEQVDGDLTELTPSAMRELSKGVSKVDQPCDIIKTNMKRANYPPVVVNSVVKNHQVRQEAQSELRNTILNWIGTRNTDHELYREFYYKFGTDIMSAQMLGRPDAEKLNKKIREIGP